MKIINTCYAIYGNKTIFSLIFYCFIFARNLGNGIVDAN